MGGHGGPQSRLVVWIGISALLLVLLGLAVGGGVGTVATVGAESTADDAPTYDLEFAPTDASAGDQPYAFGIPGPTDQTLAEFFGTDPTAAQPEAAGDGVVYTLTDDGWQQVTAEDELHGLDGYVLADTTDHVQATAAIEQADDGLAQPAQRELTAGTNFVTPTAQGPVPGDLTFQISDGDASQVQNPFQAPTESPGFESSFSQTAISDATVEVDPFAGYYLISDSGTYTSTTNSGMDREGVNDALNVPVTTVLAASDQATAAPTAAQSTTPDPAVVVDTVGADADSTVVVTVPDGDDQIVVGTESRSDAALDGSSLAVPIETTGQPGPHTIHLIPDAELDGSVTTGEPLADGTADAAVRTTTVTVFDADIELADQTVEAPTEDGEITVASATLQDGTADDPLYQVTLYATTEDGELDPETPLGTTPVSAGSIEETAVTLQDAAGEDVTIDSTDDVVARLHRVDDSDVTGGDVPPPDTFDPVPLATPDGFGSAGVSDDAEIEVLGVEGTTLSFASQAVGTDAAGNAVVYVDELAAGELTPQVSDPDEDFVVLFEGEELTHDSLVDVARIADATDGELLLDAEDASPATHTVAVVADSRSEGSLEDDSVGEIDHPALTAADADTDTETADTSETYLLVLEADLETSAVMTQSGADVQSTLQTQAERAQEPVVEQATDLGADITRQYWIANVVAVTVDPTAVSKADLEAIPEVEHVEANVEHAHPAPQPADEEGELQTQTDGDGVTEGLDRIDIQQFEAEFETRGTDTRIAILDDGLDPDHPDIDVTLGVTVADGEVSDPEDTDLERASGHGEHVAGTATGAADPAGDVPRYSVAPDADLLKADVFEGGAPTTDLLAGIEWAVEEDADVVGMSLGLGGSEQSTIQLSIEEATQVATDSGTVVIASSGNEGQDGTGGPVTSPGTEFSTVGVGAVDSTGAVADFSSGAVITPNTATVTDGAYPATYPRSYVAPTVTGPGVDVLSAGPLGTEVGSDPDYSTASGTSMAAPHVAGAVALIQSATDAQHSPTAIEHALAETATPPPDAPSSTAPRQSPFGAGTINVTAAALALEETTPIDGTVTDASVESESVVESDPDPEIAGASVTTDSGVVAATDTDGTYDTVVTSDSETVDLTIDAFGYAATTESVSTGSEATVDAELEPTVDVEIIEPQPQTVEAGSEFTITADVRNLESYTVVLADDSDLDASDIDVTVGEQSVTLGTPLEDVPTDADGVPITVTIDADADPDATFALEHTFAGPGDDVTQTTGPTSVAAELQPAFELTNFEAPAGQSVGSEEPYTATVTVTNVGNDAGTVELTWFMGPLAAEEDPESITLEPDETETVSLDFGALDVGSFFDDQPVRLFHGFEAVPADDAVRTDMIVDDFTVGDGSVPILDPLGTDRGVGQTAPVVTTDLAIEDQSAGDDGTTITVSTADVQPPSTEYVVAVSEDLDAPVLGTSETLTGAASDVTITLDEPLTEETDVVVTLRPVDDESPDGIGDPIHVYDPLAGDLTPVTATATISIPEAETASVTAPRPVAPAD